MIHQQQKRIEKLEEKRDKKRLPRVVIYDPNDPDKEYPPGTTVIEQVYVGLDRKPLDPQPGVTVHLPDNGRDDP